MRKHSCDKLQTVMCILCFCFGSSSGVIHFRRLRLLCYQSSFTAGDVRALKLEVKATPAALSRLTCAAMTVRYLGSPSCSDDSSSSSSLPLYSYSVSSEDKSGENVQFLRISSVFLFCFFKATVKSQMFLLSCNLKIYIQKLDISQKNSRVKWCLMQFFFKSAMKPLL